MFLLGNNTKPEVMLITLKLQTVTQNRGWLKCDGLTDSGLGFRANS